MGMSVGGGGKGRVRPDMNVTPLVDVVLVLLIIFMILAPIVTQAFAVRLPPKDKDDDKQEELDEANDPNKPLVLTITADGTYQVNSVDIESDELSTRMHRMFNARPDNVVYIDGEDEAPVGAVLVGVDLARQGGASPVVFITHKLE